MTADRRAALVENVARAIALSEKFDWDNEDLAEFRDSFRRNAIAVIDIIRAEVLEEAARVAEMTPQQFVVVGMRCEVVDNSKTIAAAIRNLKGEEKNR
jgi:hypothetical protein